MLGLWRPQEFGLFIIKVPNQTLYAMNTMAEENLAFHIWIDLLEASLSLCQAAVKVFDGKNMKASR